MDKERFFDWLDEAIETWKLLKKLGSYKECSILLGPSELLVDIETWKALMRFTDLALKVETFKSDKKHYIRWSCEYRDTEIVWLEEKNFEEVED